MKQQKVQYTHIYTLGISGIFTTNLYNVDDDQTTTGNEIHKM